MCYRSTDLCEYSAVAVPGNQQCLTLIRGPQYSGCRETRSDAAGRTDQAGRRRHMKPLRPALMKDGDGWHIIDANGGIISSHESREEAQLKLDNLAAEHVETAEHGSGGDDDTRKEVSLSLPPLTGRSLDQKKAELLSQIRGMFDPTELVQQIVDRRDQMAGKV